MGRLHACVVRHCQYGYSAHYNPWGDWYCKAENNLFVCFESMSACMPGWLGLNGVPPSSRVLASQHNHMYGACGPTTAYLLLLIRHALFLLYSITQVL